MNPTDVIEARREQPPPLAPQINVLSIEKPDAILHLVDFPGVVGSGQVGVDGYVHRRGQRKARHEEQEVDENENEGDPGR